MDQHFNIQCKKQQQQQQLQQQQPSLKTTSESPDNSMTLVPFKLNKVTKCLPRCVTCNLFFLNIIQTRNSVS